MNKTEKFMYFFAIFVGILFWFYFIIKKDLIGIISFSSAYLYYVLNIIIQGFKKLSNEVKKWQR